jgi:hypothetical protein
MSHIHWVERQNKLEIPKEKDEVNKREVHEYDIKGARACPTTGELWVVQPPIHPRVRPADNSGKFFVLCFHPVTFPRALCTQVGQPSARETMVTADSGSARGRHWKSWGLGPPGTVQTHFPHSGNRKA